MSTFFKALEQAERDRARLEGTAPRPASRPVPPGSPLEAPMASAAAAEPEVASPEPPAPARAPEGPSRPGAAAPGVHAGAGVGEIDEHLVSLLQPAGFAAEQYRGIRLAVEQQRRSAGHAVFAVSSPGVGDGKTTTAINLAGTLAQGTSSRVLLVDADLRQPSVGERLGLGSMPARGLVDLVLTPGVTLDAVVRRFPSYNLSVLPAGHPPAAPYEILESPRFDECLEAARHSYDYVVLDTPPIVAAPDCRVITKRVDGLLIVIAAHRTPRKLVEEALDLMEPSKVIGLVFTRDDGLVSDYPCRLGNRYFPAT